MKNTVNKIITVFLAISISCFSLQTLHAEENDISSTELIENSDAYDGKRVVFYGEAIGDILYRGSYAWINVSDGNNSAIGIWMTKQYADSVINTGGYQRRGDMIRISGVFHKACGEHGGDPDIHADDLTVVSKGYFSREEIPTSLIALAVGSVCITAMLMICLIRKRKQI